MESEMVAGIEGVDAVLLGDLERADDGRDVSGAPLRRPP
jgi:hypothetical protein